MVEVESEFEQEEIKGLRNIINNLYAFQGCQITKVKFSNNDGIVLAIGEALRDFSPIRFHSTCAYDGKSLMVKSSISEVNMEPYNSIDTFYFEPDEIKVVSAIATESEPQVRTIPYVSSHRAR